MGLLYLVCALYWALSLSFVAANIPPDYTVRNTPGRRDVDTYQAIRREISKAALQQRDTVLKNTTTLDRSWDGAVLLKFGAEKTVAENNASSLSVNADVEIVCTTCYVMGKATVELSFEGDFNASQIIGQTLDQVKDKVENFTDTVEDYFVNYTKGLPDKFEDGISLDDFAFPTFPFDFGLNITSIPECNLKFQFDGMELYMLIDTILSLGATYEINLYSSNTPLGISITKDLEVGIIFAIDLILSVEGEIDISSGFHIKLDDGLAINIALFSDDVSDIIFNGGKFEFLPVTIESAGIVFSAILRVGIHAGFNLVTPSIPPITIFDTTLEIPSIGGGIEVGVFANIAEFITNVTVTPQEECKLNVVQSYQLALGAVAGATVAFDTHTWGPVAETSVPIFYTEIGSLCAIQKTAASTPIPTITPRAEAERRQDMETTTITTKITYTGVNCISTGLANCPVSLQNTSQSIETKTIMTVVPSGSDVVLPASVQDTVPTTVAFSSNAKELPKMSGSPTSYIPPSPTDKDGDGKPDNEEKSLNGEVGGVSKKVIVGVSVGLGVPFIIALIAGLLLFQRRRKYSAPRYEATPMMAEPYGHGETQYTDKPARPGVAVTEVGHR